MSDLHRIRILGRELQVRSSAPPETVQGIENYVNEKLEEIKGSVKSGDFQIVAILALMTLAEEALALRNFKDSEAEKADRIQKLVDRIESFCNGFTVS